MPADVDSIIEELKVRYLEDSGKESVVFSKELDKQLREIADKASKGHPELDAKTIAKTMHKNFLPDPTKKVGRLQKEVAPSELALDRQRLGFEKRGFFSKNTDSSKKEKSLETDLLKAQKKAEKKAEKESPKGKAKAEKKAAQKAEQEAAQEEAQKAKSVKAKEAEAWKKEMAGGMLVPGGSHLERDRTKLMLEREDGTTFIPKKVVREKATPSGKWPGKQSQQKPAAPVAPPTPKTAAAPPQPSRKLDTSPDTSRLGVKAVEDLAGSQKPIAKQAAAIAKMMTSPQDPPPTNAAGQRTSRTQDGPSASH